MSELLAIVFIGVFIFFAGVAVGIVLCGWATAVDYDELKIGEQEWEQKELS